MSKPQFVGAAIDDARHLARRALGGAVCQHWTVRPRHIAELIGAAAAAQYIEHEMPLPPLRVPSHSTPIKQPAQRTPAVKATTG